MNKSLQKTTNQTFLQLLDDLKIDEKDVFLRDFLDDDYQKFIKKLAIIYWLRKKRPVDIIKNNLEVTQKEISEAKNLMDKKGIKLAIKYMEAEEFANIWVEKIKKFKKK